MKLIEERLPGRTEAEGRALAVHVRKLESAERKLQREGARARPVTERGMAGRLERILLLREEIDNAEAALKKRCDELAAARLKLLPDDATGIQIGASGGDVWDDRRYPVVCTSKGRLVSLGGCSTLGPAQDRERWFRLAAKRRR